MHPLRTGFVPERVDWSPMELFHRLADAACARIRLRIVERHMEDRIQFRNIGFDSHRAAFEALHGTTVPAIWDGTRLHEGEAACEVVLIPL